MSKQGTLVGLISIAKKLVTSLQQQSEDTGGNSGNASLSSKT
jgi:hypothetical protein